MAEWYEAMVYGRSHAGRTGSNPAGVMEVCLLSVLYVVIQMCVIKKLENEVAKARVGLLR